MSEKGVGESIELLSQNLGCVKLRGFGKGEDQIRYVVKRGTEETGFTEELVKPSACIKEIVTYLVC